MAFDMRNGINRAFELGDYMAIYNVKVARFTIVDKDVFEYINKKQETYGGGVRYDPIEDNWWFDGQLHVLVMSVEDGYTVDHKSRIRFDNRRANLRPATLTMQVRNRDPGQPKEDHQLVYDLGLPFTPKYMYLTDNMFRIDGHPTEPDSCTGERNNHISILGKFHKALLKLKKLYAKLDPNHFMINYDDHREQARVALELAEKVIAESGWVIDRMWLDDFIKYRIKNFDWIYAPPWKIVDMMLERTTAALLAVSPIKTIGDMHHITVDGITTSWRQWGGPLTSDEIAILSGYKWRYLEGSVVRGKQMLPFTKSNNGMDMDVERVAQHVIRNPVDVMLVKIPTGNPQYTILRKNTGRGVAKYAIIDTEYDKLIDRLTFTCEDKDMQWKTAMKSPTAKSGRNSKVESAFPAVFNLFPDAKYLYLHDFVYHVLGCNPVVPGFRVVPHNRSYNDARKCNLRYVPEALATVRCEMLAPPDSVLDALDLDVMPKFISMRGDERTSTIYFESNMNQRKFLTSRSQTVTVNDKLDEVVCLVRAEFAHLGLDYDAEQIDYAYLRKSYLQLTDEFPTSQCLINKEADILMQLGASSRPPRKIQFYNPNTTPPALLGYYDTMDEAASDIVFKTADSSLDVNGLQRAARRGTVYGGYLWNNVQVGQDPTGQYEVIRASTHVSDATSSTPTASAPTPRIVQPSPTTAPDAPGPSDDARSRHKQELLDGLIPALEKMDIDRMEELYKQVTGSSPQQKRGHVDVEPSPSTESVASASSKDTDDGPTNKRARYVGRVAYLSEDMSKIESCFDNPMLLCAALRLTGPSVTQLFEDDTGRVRRWDDVSLELRHAFRTPSHSCTTIQRYDMSTTPPTLVATYNNACDAVRIFRLENPGAQLTSGNVLNAAKDKKMYHGFRWFVLDASDDRTAAHDIGDTAESDVQQRYKGAIVRLNADLSAVARYFTSTKAAIDETGTSRFIINASMNASGEWRRWDTLDPALKATHEFAGAPATAHHLSVSVNRTDVLTGKVEHFASKTDVAITMKTTLTTLNKYIVSGDPFRGYVFESDNA
jgi:hypothetical protein